MIGYEAFPELEDGARDSSRLTPDRASVTMAPVKWGMGYSRLAN